MRTPFSTSSISGEQSQACLSYADARKVTLRRSFAAVATCLLLSVSLFAQPKHDNNNKGDKCNWKERMQAERVGFITNALELTTDEAEAFWPVYNAITKERETKMANIHKKYFALKHAVAPEQHKDGKAGYGPDSKIGTKSEANTKPGGGKADTAKSGEVKDLNTLLNEYAAALAANGADEEKWLQRYLEVLPAEKVAKLYVAEETFRRQQIGKLGGGPGREKPDGEKPDGNKSHGDRPANGKKH